MTNPHKGRTGLSRVLHATGHSAAGLRAAYRNESAFRQEFWLAVVMIPASFWLGRNWITKSDPTKVEPKASDAEESAAAAQ